MFSPVESLRTASIILAEDNEDDRALAFRALRKCDLPVAVQVATDGERALDLIKRDEAPDLIILDVKMPRLSGIDVLRTVREDARLREIPVVMMTSSDEPADIRVCRSLEADSYVRKPVDYTEFLSVVSQVTEFWLKNARGATGAPYSLLPARVGAAE